MFVAKQIGKKQRFNSDMTEAVININHLLVGGFNPFEKY